MPRPRGGDWLEDEASSWRQSGVGVIVSLLTRDEVADLDLAKEEALCQASGIQFLAFPIVDRSVPKSREAVSDLVANLADSIAQGKSVAVHCRQGIGRAALIAVCTLVRLGLQPQEAIRRVSTARGCPIPETPEQRQWILDFARTAMKPLPR
jgi:protein-tyrosine phosphatase